MGGVLWALHLWTATRGHAPGRRAAAIAAGGRPGLEQRGAQEQAPQHTHSGTRPAASQCLPHLSAAAPRASSSCARTATERRRAGSAASSTGQHGAVRRRWEAGGRIRAGRPFQGRDGLSKRRSWPTTIHANGFKPEMDVSSVAALQNCSKCSTLPARAAPPPPLHHHRCCCRHRQHTPLQPRAAGAASREDMSRCGLQKERAGRRWGSPGPWLWCDRAAPAACGLPPLPAAYRLATVSCIAVCMSS